MKVIVDTNILFSALLKVPNKFAETIFLSGDSFYTPRYALSELIRHEDKIKECSKLSEDEIYEMLFRLLSNIQVEDENKISTRLLTQAYNLCKNIDEKDFLIVALVLHIEDSELWTSDKPLIKGLREQGFNRFYKMKGI